MKLSIQHTKLFARQGGKDAVTSNKQVVNTAFSHDVLDLGNNSEPVQLDNDSVLVLRVNKHVPSTQQDLAAVTPEIKKRLLQQKTMAKAKELGSILLNPVEEAQQKQLITEHHLAWQSIEKASRDQNHRTY